MDKFPKRKSIRLDEYDYSQDGCYFVTICTKDRIPILSKIECVNTRVGTGVLACPSYKIILSSIGKEVEKTIHFININYDGVNIDNYTIMPDHIHLLIRLGNKDEQSADRRGRLSLRDVVSRLKTYTTKQYRIISNNKDLLLWQKRYYDHIIRNDDDYIEKSEYITNNVLKWVDVKTGTKEI